MCVFTEVRDSRLPLHTPGFSLFFFFFARPDGMLNLHTIHTHTEADEHTSIQIPDVFLHAFATDHWRSTVAQREINK